MKHRWLVWGLAACTLVVAFFWQISLPGKPIARLQPPAPSPPTDVLTVLDLNMLHGYPDFRFLPRRVVLLQHALADVQPDLVLLQEVPWRPETGLVAQTLAGETYAWVYARANGNRHLIRFEEGETLLSRYPLTVEDVHELRPQARPFEHRIVLRVRMHLPQGDLLVYVTHLTNKEAEINAAQAADLYHYVEATTDGTPALIAGDFNAHPDEPTIRQLSGWVDVWGATRGMENGFTCCVHDLTTPQGDAGGRIDYLFYRPAASPPTLTLEDVRLAFDQPFPTPDGPLWVSDHFGLLARFRLDAP